MDLNSLKDTVSNLTLYDIKAGVRKVQNAVMNYTEMEAKVREATNNEPWGASSTLMQEIANGTFNYQTLNEIMPMIYRRFTEKSAEEWRQIYKALQLLEFLIKHGSERVIDDARSHLTLLKMLRQFHFIDANGKDQGVNVRNRAKELAELLSDVDRIRNERKKARANKAKYTAVPPPRSFVSPPLAPQITSHASNAPFAQPQPVSAPQQANLGSMVGLSSISPPPASGGPNYSAFSTPLTATTTLSPQQPARPAGYQPTGPNYFTSVPVSAGPATSASLGAAAAASKPAAKPSSGGGDAFGALWSSAAGSIKKEKTPTASPAMGQLAKEKSAAGIWGAPAPAPKPAAGSGSNGLDSLL